MAHTRVRAIVHAAVIALALMIGIAACRDANPISGGGFFSNGPGWPFTASFDGSMNRYLIALNGGRVDTLWGLVEGDINFYGDTAKKVELSLHGFFNVDGRGPFRSVQFDTIALAEQRGQYQSNSVPITSSLLYAALSTVATGTMPPRSVHQWNLVGPDGENIIDTISIPSPLSPVTISAANDTIDTHQPLTITWSNPEPGGMVLIELIEAAPDTLHYPVPQVYIVPDDPGRFTIPADSLAGRVWSFFDPNSMLIHIARGHYNHAVTYDRGAKRLGNFIFTDEYVGAYIKQ